MCTKPVFFFTNSLGKQTINVRQIQKSKVEGTRRIIQKQSDNYKNQRLDIVHTKLHQQFTMKVCEHSPYTVQGTEVWACSLTPQAWKQPLVKHCAVRRGTLQIKLSLTRTKGGICNKIDVNNSH